MKLSSSISILFIVSQLLLYVCPGQSCTASQERVKKALILRNGLLKPDSDLYHVVLMVVTSCNNRERYHLIDLMNNSGRIRINHRIHHNNFCQALIQRHKGGSCVRPCSYVYHIYSWKTMSDIKYVMAMYEGREYILHYDEDYEEVSGRNSITLTRDILERLGESYQLQCGSTNDGMGEASSWRIRGRILQGCETDWPDRSC